MSWMRNRIVKVATVIIWKTNYISGILKSARIKEVREKLQEEKINYNTHTHTKLSGFLLRNTESVCQINFKKDNEKTNRKKTKQKRKVNNSKEVRIIMKIFVKTRKQNNLLQSTKKKQI